MPLLQGSLRACAITGYPTPAELRMTIKGDATVAVRKEDSNNRAGCALPRLPHRPRCPMPQRLIKCSLKTPSSLPNEQVLVYASSVVI